MSAEEKARGEDPAPGGVGAVILAEETKRVETSPGRAKVWYHQRAKIVSEEGLRLAAIEIPDVDEETKVETWWGRVVTPAGKVSRLKQDKLRDRLDPDSGERSIGGRLPGAAVGCVVDWGYELTGARFPLFEVVRLQREWPVDRLTYRWRRAGTPNVAGAVGGYRLQHAEPGMSVTHDGQGGVLRAERVPAAGKASLALWQPRPHALTDSALAGWDRAVESFWNDEAGRIERRAVRFAGRPKRLRTAIDAARLAEGVDPDERLRAAYAWIDANLKGRASLLSGTPAIAARRVSGRADLVLTARVGTPIQRVLCFLAVARALGADASLVLATDRSAWTWDRFMLLSEQFSHALVELRVPGAETVFVAPGSGLPYGQIPPAVAGGKALRVGADRAEAIELPGIGGE